jgi:hypothetical protein
MSDDITPLDEMVPESRTDFNYKMVSQSIWMLQRLKRGYYDEESEEYQKIKDVIDMLETLRLETNWTTKEK